MKASVVIPTYHRVDDLSKCLGSLVIQTVFPNEVLIVDDSENNEVHNLIVKKTKEFKRKQIMLKYIKNVRERSLTIARNIGTKNSSGDIIFYFDSDIILHKNYIKEILKIYEQHSEAKGVQGYIYHNRMLLREVLGKLHFVSSFAEKDKCKIYSSLVVSYPYSLSKIINCEWLSGANQSYKKEVLEEFRWDENLKKYCWGEDLDLPYRIFKKYPNSLFITPYAKAVHSVSEEGRHVKKELVYMEEVYRYYLFCKNVKQSLKNKIVYLWSSLGRFVVKIISRKSEIKYVVGSFWCCFQHRKTIQKGELE